MEGLPGFMVDLSFERSPKGFVWIAGTEEVGMTDEEAFLVVVGIDEPAGNTVSAVAADFARVGVEYIDSVDLDLDLTVFRIEYVDVRFSEDDKEIAFAVIL